VLAGMLAEIVAERVSIAEPNDESRQE